MFVPRSEHTCVQHWTGKGRVGQGLGARRSGSGLALTLPNRPASLWLHGPNFLGLSSQWPWELPSVTLLPQAGLPVLLSLLLQSPQAWLTAVGSLGLVINHGDPRLLPKVQQLDSSSVKAHLGVASLTGRGLLDPV